MSATPLPLLTYAVSPSQSPIQASPQMGDPSTVSLVIVVSNSTHQLINCQSISFGFLQGTDAKDFFSSSSGIGTSSPTGWGLTQDGSLFTATPDTAEDGQIGASGLIFSLSGIQVNTQPGATDMTITEVTSSQTGTLPIPLAKFPPQFTVGQLSANPVTVTQGESTMLSWSCSSGAIYALQYLDVNGQTVKITQTEDGQPLPAVGSYTIENLQATTIFYLIVTLAEPGQSEPLVFETFFPVSVSIPNVQIVSFTASTQTVDSPGDEVTFTWEVKAATQVQLNGVEVEGNSATVAVNETGNFVLTALGQGGPVSWVIVVTVSSVKINSFTANTAVVYGQNNNASVTLAWDVEYAEKLILYTSSGSIIVTGQSQNAVVVNQSYNFMLQANGYNGPVDAVLGINIAPVALTISTDSTGVNVSFNANPGTYTSNMILVCHFYGNNKPFVIPYVQTIKVSKFGQVQYSQDLGQLMQVLSILSVQVLLYGFSSGVVTTIYSPD